jgi:hypothetical protein
MFGIFGLILSLIIIVIYSIVYSVLVLIILYTFSKLTRIGWLKKMMKFRLLTFLALWTVFGIAFLFYHFSYWQDSGFGDSYKIPIGNNYQVSNIDGVSTYFEDSKSGGGRQAFLTNFSIANNKLCANFQGFNSTDCKDCFIVFDTETSKMYEFYSTHEYETFARENHLPLPDSFREFMDNYNDYWTKNRRWYLP